MTPAPVDPPCQAVSREVLLERYARAGETTVDDVRRRIAAALAEAEAPGSRGGWAERFLWAQRQGFIAGGRIAAHAGAGAAGTMLSCFVQPVSDSLRGTDADAPGIYAALAETAETLRRGGGVGIDFSPLRPCGAQVAGSETLAAGPLGFMRLFDTSCTVLGAMARRRGAQMAVLRCDHPDIEQFAGAKRDGGLTTFNLSVAVTDAFMNAVEADAEFELVHAAEPGAAFPDARRRPDGRWTYRRVAARRLWELLVQHAHAGGEPGVLFIDRIHRDDNLAYCERIAATNPCAEQPLPPYGACCLGAVDLTRLVVDPFEPTARIDLGRLRSIVPVAVRMLDDVLDLTAWPLARHRDEALSKRRIGLGFTGLGDALVMLGLPYGSAPASAVAADVARALRDAAYAASVALARERGAFALFDADGVLAPGRFASRLPGELQRAIRAHGLRNSHLLSVAPAGSISLAFADNASSGIEPPFAWQYVRRRRPAGPRAGALEQAVEDRAWREYRRLRGPQAALTPAFVTASELSPHDHLAMVAAVAPFVDGSISKTVNAPEACTREAFDALFREAWACGLKGVTAFRPNRPLGAVLRAAPPPTGPPTPA